MKRLNQSERFFIKKTTNDETVIEMQMAFKDRRSFKQKKGITIKTYSPNRALNKKKINYRESLLGTTIIACDI